MISTSDRRQCVELVNEAHAAGARLKPACETLGISLRTYQRWTEDGDIREDQRPLVQRAKPAHALTSEEIQRVLATCNEARFASLPPAQIVARLLDEDKCYLASESSMYRILRAHGQLKRRGRAKTPTPRPKPTTYHAKAPNAVLVWDCTWLPGPIRGEYHYLIVLRKPAPPVTRVRVWWE